MQKNKLLLIGATLYGVFIINATKAQQLPGSISGAFQADVASYNPDSLIGAPDVPEEIGLNSYMDIKYVNGNFKAGLRYEVYLNALQGYDPRYKGTGLTNRYASYTYENFEITAGSFYEQFGSGLIFRSYYDYDLGYDNPIDGINIRYNTHGVYTKAFVGRQRAFFEYGPGIVRGIDGEVHLTEMFPDAKWGKHNLIIGGSFVSKYQADNDPIYKLPENVGASAARLNYTYGPLNLFAEYAYKINDPSLVNGGIYKPGQSLYVSGTYSKKGFGFNAAIKRIDNMNFRSDRNESVNVLNINFIPAISKNQTYRLATLYPYASQVNGEIGAMAELYYNCKAGSLLGGKYGTGINVNTSNIRDIKRNYTGDEYGYKSDFFTIGDTVFYQDINVELSKKINKNLKVVATYIYQAYNQTVVEGKSKSPLVFADVAVLDFTYKFSSTKSLRMEFQGLWTEQDRGDWAFVLAEVNVLKNFSVNIYDEYNYGNKDESLRLHFLNGGIVYNKNATRIALGYGKQRSGLLCVGGVCRLVPASNGFTFSVSTSF